MHDEPVRTEPPRAEPHRAPGKHAARFKRHSLDLGDGASLVLGTDGAIAHVDPHGSVLRTWLAGDPQWPDQAIRFGIRPQAPTVSPQGRSVQGTKPPRR